jgi:choline-glycine betaine transporter
MILMLFMAWSFIKSISVDSEAVQTPKKRKTAKRPIESAAVAEPTRGAST